MAGLAAEDYLLSGAEPVQISTYSIVYTKPGGYNRAVADFEYLKPKSVRTTRWGKTGWVSFMSADHSYLLCGYESRADQHLCRHMTS